MYIFFQTLPCDIRGLMRGFLLSACLFVTIMIPIMAAEGCVKRPSLEPAPGAAPQTFQTHKDVRHQFMGLRF